MSAPVFHAPMPGAEDLTEPLRSRWSPSIFDAGHRLSADEVERLLHAAQWAPSKGNTQPWGFVVAVRGDAAHRAFVPHLSRGNSWWVPRASLVLVGGAQVAIPPGEDDGKGIDPDFARYDLGQAVAHLTLQARSMDLHAHQFAGFDHPAAAAALGVPEHVQLMAGVAVGVRGEAAGLAERDREREQRVRSRKPLTEVAFGERWGVPWMS